MARGRRVVAAPRIGLVGTYPPTKCGIATFTASLADAITTAAPRCRFGVVACTDDQAVRSYSKDVVAELVSGSPESLTAAAATLREFDIAIVQHEFGIYGGPDGSEVVELVREAGVPTIVVLHTVLR